MQRNLFGSMQNAKPITPTRLQIGSWNASTNYSNTNFVDIFANGQIISDVKQIHMISATIPNLFPTFGKADSLLRVTYKGASYSIQCDTNGRYTGDTMLTHLNSLFAAQGNLADITVTYNAGVAGYKKLLFSHPAQASAANDLKFVQDQASLWKWGILNPTFSRGVVSTTPSTVACDGVVREIRTSLIYVRSSISNDSTNSAGLENILGVISIDVPWGDVIQWREFLDENWVDVSVSSLSSMNIQLLDEDFQELTLPSNAYTTFQFDCRNFIKS